MKGKENNIQMVTHSYIIEETCKVKNYFTNCFKRSLNLQITDDQIVIKLKIIQPSKKNTESNDSLASLKDIHKLVTDLSKHVNNLNFFQNDLQQFVKQTTANEKFLEGFDFYSCNNPFDISE